jgi:predicted nucleic acid-binding protein
MMRILLDTDVILDFLLAREPFAADARAIWVACEQQRCIGYVSAITPINTYYIGRKLVGTEAARQHVADMLQILYVSAIDQAILAEAQASDMRDFEDAVQAAAARADRLDAIITRNGDDYASASIPIMTPAEFLQTLQQQP